MEAWSLCCGLGSPVEETPGLDCHHCLGLGPPETGQEGQRDCPGGAETWRQKSTPRLEPHPAGKPGRTQAWTTECWPHSQPQCQAGAQRGRVLWGQGMGLTEGGAVAASAGHTAGTQQGLNKCLSNLFSCYVWAGSPIIALPRGCEPWALRSGPNILDELESSPTWGSSGWRQAGRAAWVLSIAGGAVQERGETYMSRNFSNVTPS